MNPGTFVAIGHIVNDTEPYDHLGGGVAYSAVSASKLGLSSYIITKCPKNHPYLKELKNLGVAVIRLPSHIDTLTSFSNFCDKTGRRKQKVLKQQESIELFDFAAFPKNILKKAIILVATVVGEVDIKLFPLLASLGTLTVTPQGYFRRIAKDNTVYQKPWSEFEDYLKYAKITVLSEEDLPVNEIARNTVLNKLKKNTSFLVVTKGKNGVNIYNDGNVMAHTAFPLFDREIKDLTGAGDIYATAFITHYLKYKNANMAAVFASLFAALKIRGIGSIGINSIPRMEEMTRYFKKNKERIDVFLKRNDISQLSAKFHL